MALTTAQRGVLERLRDELDPGYMVRAGHAEEDPDVDGVVDVDDARFEPAAELIDNWLAEPEGDVDEMLQEALDAIWVPYTEQDDVHPDEDDAVYWAAQDRLMDAWRAMTPDPAPNPDPRVDALLRSLQTRLDDAGFPDLAEGIEDYISDGGKGWKGPGEFLSHLGRDVWWDFKHVGEEDEIDIYRRAEDDIDGTWKRIKGL